MSNDATNVTLRKVHDILVVELPAVLNAETQPHFNEKVEYALADTPGALILDFSRVGSADAAGVQALDFAFVRSAEIDMPLALTGLAPAVKPLVETAGYLERAGYFATVDEAVASGL